MSHTDLQMPISVVIITFNEENNIRECLESVRMASDIIVVDSNSTDHTLEIARNYTDKIYQKPWEGYSAARNFGLSQASEKWALFLDAAERASEDLPAEIKRGASLEMQTLSGYYIPRKSFYLGRWIHHGEWNPDYKLRLVKKTAARWVGEVYEEIRLSGDSGYLRHFIHHYTYHNIKQHYEKFKRCSTLFAEEAFKQGISAAD